MNIEIDLRTLSLTLILFSVLFGIGMFLFGRAYRSFVGIKLMGLGYLIIGIGHFLLGMRDVLNDFTTIVVANPVICLGAILIYRGLFSFLDITPKLGYHFNLLLIPLFAGLLYYYRFQDPDINVRIILFSLFYSLTCFIPAFGIWKRYKNHSSIQIHILFYMFFIMGIFYLFRTVWTSFETQHLNFMDAGVIHSITVIVSELLVIMTSFITIWMASDKLQEKLSIMARTDSLTQIYNRRTFEESCDVELSRASRKKSTFSIIICDLDLFKNINDQYGHPMGDEVLKVFAGVLRDNVRRHDVVARFGGEEFVILLPETDSNRSMIVAENIRKKTRSSCISSKDYSNILFSASFGVSHYDHDDNDWMSVLKRADKALYSAKQNGRDRVVVLEKGKESSSEAVQPAAATKNSAMLIAN